MTPEEKAQWVINNRYSKSEHEKVSDAEMFHLVKDAITEALNTINWIPIDADKLPDGLVLWTDGMGISTGKVQQSPTTKAVYVRELREPATHYAHVNLP
jgi:hypothetical protein